METPNRKRKIMAYINRNYRIISLIAIVLMLPSIYWLVYATGGITYVYSHTMYIPILLAGIFLGTEYGVVTALVAAILLGPLMPLDVEQGIAQDFINWFYRMVIFILLGYISGFASNKLRKNAKAIDELMSYDQETHVPNTNFIIRYPHYLDNNRQSVITVLITNNNHIVDVMGTEIYHRLIGKIYTELVTRLPGKKLVIQAETNKIWIIMTLVDVKQDTENVCKCLNQTWEIDGIPLYVDFAVGASEIGSPKDCEKLACFTASDVSARFAQAKNLPYVVYDKSLMRRRQEFELLTGFTSALENNETFLAFQPKYDLKTLKPIGLEALIRWNHPQKGLIMPDEFIPLLEETKLIHALTDWVFEKVARQVEAFVNIGIKVPISVNVSAKNLYDPKFFKRTMAIIENTKIEKSLIEIEITESVLMANPAESQAMLDKFVRAGIKIAIDDFGKGYSSLAYLSQFPISEIKIDKFFMRQIAYNTTTQQIVKATIQLSKQLGYLVLVEGVEDERTVKIMQDYGCDLAQGYHFAKPIPGDEIIDWYQNHI
ncbi:MAG: EAL domain-containing protein [Bacilli bacterium]|nr:EAL domain-containing protein [Bacilli bacterium]MBN2696160.1 EAL domain-containing protein [Bacilli bacterium]